MNIGNRNLFVTSFKCGVEEKQMDRETLEYWLLILSPTLTCLENLGMSLILSPFLKRASILQLVFVIQLGKKLVK